MFTQSRIKQSRKSGLFSRAAADIGLETLEDRRLLSAAAGVSVNLPKLPAHGDTIEFDLTPTVVQTGLDNLATTDGVSAPTPTQTVLLHNVGGVEAYTVDITGTGTKTVLTVNAKGAPVTLPTRSTTTWGVLDGAGAGSNPAAAAEISAIVTAENLTAPTDSTTINVVTFSGGTSIYSLKLDKSGHGKHVKSTRIFVNSDGDPVGNQILPFSVMVPAVQQGLINAAPAGSGLTSSSTQAVYVRSYDGVATYTMTFRTTGTVTTITVDKTGALVNRPRRTDTTFSSIPLAAQAELSALAVDDGDTTAIGASHKVTSFAETNGTTVYRILLATAGGEQFRISVDENGDPTVPPQDDSDRDCFHHHHGHGRGVDIATALGLGYGPGGKYGDLSA
jgi:hypothetical protein